MQLISGDVASEPSQLSEAQRQIIRHIASLSVWCESEEAKMADGVEIDIDQFQRASNSLRRLTQTIGLRRRARDITPSLSEYVRGKYGHAEDAEELEDA